MWDELKEYIYDQIQLESESIDITGFEEANNIGDGKIRAFDLVLRKIKEIEQRYM